MVQIKKIILKRKFGNNYHPWIYKNHIASVDPGINAGDLVRIMTYNNACLGIGYYNPKSLIRVRMLTQGDELFNKRYFINRIHDAVQKRTQIKEISNAYRIVFSEADNLPGLIADIYDDTAVFQITTLGMDRFRDEVINALRDIIGPKYIYEKSDISSRKFEGLEPVCRWHGDEGKGQILIFENKACFYVDIMQGHKTGFYLDQRKSRIAATTFANGKRVLDVFCYTGAFSIHAALGNAKSVTGIDIKAEWLMQAKNNVDLNNIPGNVNLIKNNAFDAMHEFIKKNEQFDMIILDPPSFIKKKNKIKNALSGYLELNRYAMRLLSDNGLLCTFSCSHHIRNDIFSDMLKKAAILENKKISILKRCRQDKDHPIIKAIPETEYLKGYFMRVSSGRQEEKAH